ncbi:MAG: hypothetical protein CL832_09035 [Crocinitomicaceae bacterium]|nr:hypothetical protein [Crocinitomicaceae bacterium]
MFICQTPGCAIAISKATFPAAMPCPVCQNILVEEVKEELIKHEDKDLISFLPYLIAYPFEKTLKEEHTWTKVNLLKDTLLNYLKFLGLITASEFFNSPLKDKNIISSFYKNLSSPSFGSWNAFIRETLQFLDENNHDFFCPELKKYYIKVETGKKRKLYNGEIEIIDAKGDVEIKKQQATAIGMLINFRNRYLGHGLTLDKPTSEKLWEKYYPIFQNLLMGLDWCNNYIIYKNEGKNTWKLQGASINQVEVLKAKDKIWLQNKEGEKMDLVPFFIVPGEVALADNDSKLLAYESYTGKSIKFFSPEGIDKTTSGRVLERLNLIIKDKQEEKPYLPAEFTADILKDRIEKENQFVLQTLIDERKVIKGIYQSREDIEIKLRSWVGGMANVFFIGAEAGSGKTNLLVEIQRQYKEREFNSLLIRACRMAKRTLKEEIAYLLNIEPKKELSNYKALNQTQEKPLFVLIDGINESQDEQDIWKEIKEISKSFDPGVIKFVVSCRVNGKKDLDRFELGDKMDILYSESKDEVKQLSDAVFWLTPLNMVELEGAWNTYTSKNKKTTNPQFKFNDIADYDRSIYEKIKNPLILRIFLETYHNRSLPKKGKKKLHVWRDWFKSFNEEEKTLLKLLAKKVWQKDSNELELEELLNDADLEPFVTDDKVNAPYSRLIALGWISRFTKQNTIYISFTVEGLLFYLLALYLNDNIKIDVKQIEKWLKEESVIKVGSIDSYLIECVEKDDVELIADLIDHGEKTLEVAIPALTEYTKSSGSEKTLNVLLKKPSESDWKAILMLVKNLDNLLLKNIKKELLINTKNKINLKTENQILLGFKILNELDKEGKDQFFKNFNLKNPLFQNNHKIINQLSIFYEFIGEHEKALKGHNESEKLIEKIFTKNSIQFINNLLCIVDLHRKAGKQNLVKESLNKAMKIAEEIFSNNDALRISILDRLATYYRDTNMYDECINLRKQIVELNNKIYGSSHLRVASSWHNFAVALHYKAKILKSKKDKIETNRLALKYLLKKNEINQKIYSSDHRSFGPFYTMLGSTYLELGEYEKSLSFFEKSLNIRNSVYGENHGMTAFCQIDVADVHMIKKDFESALKYYNLAYNYFSSKKENNQGWRLFSLAKVISCKYKISNEKDYLDHLENIYQNHLELSSASSLYVGLLEFLFNENKRLNNSLKEKYYSEILMDLKK